ncbi:HCP-like superfamily protein with MYND-type zinc finger [Rhynchospora pubera]|uniref:HCP-like superfamily protein with MYND-type zinc finger n=1 Tax=Rhynchospora pubera TaxID=906938 RepID=A0AAV8CNZ5_9POAL|nr:HCP-like superfamily protein with MYND-type zinc finger [Rhynchospora pubera]
MEHQLKRRNRTATKKMKKKTKTSLVTKLPEDVIVEIVAQLVSSSPLPFADLCSLKKSCKTFAMLSKDRMVKKCIAIEREISTLNWTPNNRCMSILISCADAENVEACFILGLVNIFDNEDICKGVELLKKASFNGHKAAFYMINILRIRLQKDNIPVDMNSHNKVDQSTFNDYDQLKWCRERVLDVRRLMTWNKWLASNAENMRRCKNSYCGISGWDDYKCFCSDSCRWNDEYFELCRRM